MQDWKVICVRGDLFHWLDEQRKGQTFDQALRELLKIKPPDFERKEIEQ
jgi:hypothetical protein